MPIQSNDIADPKKAPDEFPELGNNGSDIDPLERKLLNEAGEDDEERSLHHAELDTTDDDGEPLNENSSVGDKTGGDLDVPGSEEDDANEDIGEEDEENNSYSLKDGDE